MAQAAMPASPFISTALYIRLSVEDNNKRGNSIETQKPVSYTHLTLPTN